MRIPNYDSKDKIKDKSPTRLIPENFRMLVCGQSNNGKTNVLVHMLLHPLIYYDKIYLYTNNHQQDKIKGLIERFNGISKKVGYNVLEVVPPDSVLDTKDYHSDGRKVVIFDDVINEPGATQKRMANHYTDKRRHGISPIYISQSYYDVPSKIPQNCSHMILYPPTTRMHYNLITKENRVGPKVFDSLRPYEFLFIDKNEKRQAKNFDEPIL